MRLTAKSEYGLLAVIDLAVSYGEGPVSAREIAERREIPARFLEQLFVSLRRGGVVSAVRGARAASCSRESPARSRCSRSSRHSRVRWRRACATRNAPQDVLERGLCSCADLGKGHLRAQRGLRNDYPRRARGNQERMDARVQSASG